MPPATRAHLGIAFNSGSSVSNTASEAARMRMQGNELLKASRVEEALSCYTQALELQPDDQAALSNRSYALYLLGRYTEAAQNATRCVQVEPQWPKGYMRLAAACMALHCWQDALAVCVAGLQHAPDNRELARLAAVCQSQLTQAQLSERTQRQALASAMSHSLQTALQVDLESDLEKQLSQSMAAPGEWSPADWQWRPTWVREQCWPTLAEDVAASDMRRDGVTEEAHRMQLETGNLQAPQLQAACVDAAAEQQADGTGSKDSIATPQQASTKEDGLKAADSLESKVQGKPVSKVQRVSPESALLSELTRVSEELNAPSELLAVLSDETRLRGYSTAIRAALGDGKGAGAHVLCLGPGAAIWALLAASHGVRHVSVLCDTALGYQAARALIEANLARVTTGSTIHVIPVPLWQHTLDSAGATPGVSVEAGTGTWRLSGGLVDWVITDQLEPCILSTRGPVTQLQLAARRGLLSPTVRVLPESVEVVGQLARDCHVGMVQGVDMSKVNSGWWYPGIRPRRMNGHDSHVKPLSDPAPLATLSLTSLARTLCSNPTVLLPVRTSQLGITATGSDICNTLYLWPVVRFGECAGGVVWDTPYGTVFNTDRASSHPASAWCVPGYTAAVSGTTPTMPQPPSPIWQPSLLQGVIHWEPKRVTMGEQVPLLVVVEAAALHVVRLPVAPSLPRHLLLPAWHMDVLMNDTRTLAYEAATRDAILHQTTASRKQGLPDTGVVVMHLGAGSGLLSTLSARCNGVERVVALEPRRALASLLVEVVSCNPATALRMCVLPQSLAGAARRVLTAQHGSQGALPHDLTSLVAHPAEVVVLENLDAGLIGEGVLRCMVLGRAAGLISPTAIIVPHAAKVMFQLVTLKPTVSDLASGSQPTSRDTPAGDDIICNLDTSALQRYIHTPADDYLALELHPTQHSASTAGPAHSSHQQPGAEVAGNGWQNSAGGVWCAVGQAVEGMTVEFARAAELHSTPEATTYQVEVVRDGLVNGVMFWSTLDMGKGLALSNAPTGRADPAAAGSGVAHTKEQVAVQMLGTGAVRVKKGDVLAVEMSHDTYSFSFKIKSAQRVTAHSTEPATASQEPGQGQGSEHSDRGDDDETGGKQQSVVPAVQHLAEVSKVLTEQLSKACTQDPLAFRRLAAAATAMAARPQDCVELPQRVSTAHLAQIAAQLYG